MAPISAEVWQAPEVTSNQRGIYSNCVMHSLWAKDINTDICPSQYVLNPERTRQSPPKDYMMVDVYSYAMLVWHIFTRQLPYGGKKMVLNEIEEELRKKNVTAD